MFTADYADFHPGYYRDVLLKAKYLSNPRLNDLVGQVWQTNISNSLFILFISLLICEF